MVPFALKGPVLAEEETDSETDGGHAGGHRSQPRGQGNGAVLDKSSSQGEVELFSPHQKSDRLSGCPMIHGHKMSEDIDLSFRNNGKSLSVSILSASDLFQHLIDMNSSSVLCCVAMHLIDLSDLEQILLLCLNMLCL